MTAVLAAGLAVTIIVLLIAYWAGGIVQFRHFAAIRYSGISIQVIAGAGILAVLLVWPRTARFPGFIVLGAA